MDTWTWDDHANQCYEEILTNKNGEICVISRFNRHNHKLCVRSNFSIMEDNVCQTEEHFSVNPHICALAQLPGVR